MANQPHRQQTFLRFWFPNWGNATPPSRPPVPTPRSATPPPPQQATQPRPPSPPQPKPRSPSRSPSAAQRQMPIRRTPRTPSSSPLLSPSQISSQKQQPAAQQASLQKPSPSTRSLSKTSSPTLKRLRSPSPSQEVFKLQQAAATQEVSQVPSLSATSVLQPDSPAKRPVEPPQQESQPTTEALSQTTVQPQPEPSSTSPQAQEQSQSEPAEAGNQTTEDLEPKKVSVDTVLSRTPTLNLESERELEEIEEENSTIIIEFIQELPSAEEKHQIDTESVEDKEPSQLPPVEEKPQMDKELKQELPPAGKRHQIDTESVEDKETSQLPPVEEKPQMDKELKQELPPAEEKHQIDTELKQDIQTSRHPQVQGKSTTEPELMQDTQPSQIPEEGRPEEIIEDKQNTELEVPKKIEIRSPKTEVEPEGNENDEPKTKLEVQLAEKSSTLTINVPKNRMEIMSAMAEPDSQTTREDLAKSELITNFRSSGKQTDLNGSQGRESTMGLANIPLTSPSPGEQARFHKEIKKGSSKLVQKQNLEQSQQLGSESTKGIITLAGENEGATMFIIEHETTNKEGVHTRRGHRLLDKNKAEASSGNKEIQKQMLNHTGNKHPAITASINSNVQSISNSLLHESSCSVGDPGIHLVLSTKTNRPDKLKEKAKLAETFRSAVSTGPAQKLTYEPNIRCLRGLLMESSDRDQENLQKPQHHGCHYRCEDKRKGKAEQDSTSTINTNTKHSEKGITRA